MSKTLDNALALPSISAADAGLNLVVDALGDGYDLTQIVEKGSNANGAYIRFSSGSAICTFEATLTYVSINNLNYRWTFPIEFASAPTVVCSPFDGMVSATPTVDDISSIWWYGSTGIGGVVSLNRLFGRPDFVTGDTAKAFLVAIGEPL